MRSAWIAVAIVVTVVGGVAIVVTVVVGGAIVVAVAVAVAVAVVVVGGGVVAVAVVVGVAIAVERRCQVTSLAIILTCGIFARRAILQFPELESVAWILIVLGVFVLFATGGRITLLEVP